MADRPRTAERAGEADPAELGRLLALVVARDRLAFRTLYRHTAPVLNAVALRQIGSRDLAEEALQDVFVAVWTKAGGYDPARGSVLAWMVTMMRNRCIDLSRRRRLQGAPLGEAEAVVSEAPSPLEETALRRDGERARAALQTLPPRMRRAIELAFYEGLDYRAIAEQLGVPVNTTKSWVRRGLHRLRSELGEPTP